MSVIMCISYMIPACRPMTITRTVYETLNLRVNLARAKRRYERGQHLLVYPQSLQVIS